jgi:hypothetical protein
MVASASATDIRSFISLALAMEQPKITISASCADEGLFLGKSVDVEFEPEKALSKKQFSSIDQLIKKYESIKGYIDIGHPQEKLKADNCSPIVTFKPSTKYEIIEVSSEQLSLAKEVAQRVVKVHGLHTSGDQKAAKSEYEELQSYVSSKRDTFLGQFRNIRSLNEAVGMRGVGTNGAPRADADCTGAVIFVIIEIFVM